jgi:hypothetical protein
MAPLPMGRRWFDGQCQAKLVPDKTTRFDASTMHQWPPCMARVQEGAKLHPFDAAPESLFSVVLSASHCLPIPSEPHKPPRKPLAAHGIAPSRCTLVDTVLRSPPPNEEPPTTLLVPVPQPPGVPDANGILDCEDREGCAQKVPYLRALAALLARDLPHAQVWRQVPSLLPPSRSLNMKM